MVGVKRKQREGLIIDLKQIVNTLFRYWYFFAIGVCLFFASAYFYLKFAIPVYRTGASVYVKSNSSSSESLLNGFEFLKGEKVIEDEIGVLKSLSLSLSTVKELEMFQSYYAETSFQTYELNQEDFPVKVMVDTSHSQVVNLPVRVSPAGNNKIRVQASAQAAPLFQYDQELFERPEKVRVQIDTILPSGKSFTNEYLSLKFELNPDVEADPDIEYYFRINDLFKLAEGYSHKLSVERLSKNSSILLLSLEGPLVQKNINFLNSLCRLYLEKELQEKNRIATKTINFIDEQLQGVSDSLQLAELEMQNFRTKNNVMDLSYEARSIFDEFKDVENRRASEQMKAKYYEYLMQYVIESENVKSVTAPSTIGITDPLLNNLVNQLAMLYSEKVGAEFTMKDKNPQYQILVEKIAQVKKELKENIKNISKSSEITIQSLNDRIRSLEVRLDELPVNERKLISVQRKFALNDNIYTYLLQRRAEAGIVKASNSTDSEIIDFARVQGNGPVSPKKNMVYLVGIFLGLFIPFLIVIVKEMFNERIQSRSDIENNSSVPLLAIIRHKSKSVKNKIVFLEPKSPIAESFRSLRVNLNFLPLETGTKVITFSSSVSGEGKSFCAMNLSYALAMSGVKTILLNADLRLPYLHKEFGLRNDIGISTYLIDKARIADIIFDTEVDELKFIPSGPVPPNPFELLSGEKFSMMVEALKEEFEYIIIDTPPLGLVSDYFLISKMSNATIYVVRHDYTKLDYIDNLEKINKKNKIKNLFVVLNDYKKDLDSYGNYVNGSQSYGKNVFVNLKRRMESFGFEPFNN